MKLNITGQKFNKLTAIEITEERYGGHVIWLCQCDCGAFIKKDVCSLKRGMYPNCGAWQCSPYFEDISGRTFGRLTVIGFSHIKGTRSTSYWDCLCACGNVKKISLGSLRSGRTKSCGCIKLDGQYESIAKRSYRSHVFSAKYRKIENFLSIEEYLQIASLPCSYCGEIDIKTNTSTGAILNLNGIDRKNNERYYKVENSIPCCYIHNSMKLDLSYKDFIVKIRETAEYTKNINLDLEDKKESDR